MKASSFISFIIKYIYINPIVKFLIDPHGLHEKCYHIEQSYIIFQFLYINAKELNNQYKLKNSFFFIKKNNTVFIPFEV